ncbi:MAG TPA: tRNA (adenosine(37)-N6)-threonylcarbamoyltransferase complex dimerization subunit type 1 TsaB [Acidimicrobiales bacterium]|nr:tRNA (adenosine(37)-N6)-threonylcarbamoyltransferase complex dimerization subunit type 1 TsaB [Acidimicrobiales bacterium]
MEGLRAVLVLAVESATETAAVAVADEEGVLGSLTVAGRRHTETIAPAIEALCRRLGVALADVEMVGVDIGPGLFTGLRVGVGTAQALAFALEIPVVPAGSLEVLAHAVTLSGLAEGRLVVPVVDARRAEVFSGRFRPAPGGPVEVGSEAVSAPGELAAELAALHEGPVLVGNGALRYRSLFADVAGATLAGPAYGSPPVTALADLCVARARAGRAVDGAAVMPRYLRQADARINWEQRIPPRPARAPTP